MTYNVITRIKAVLINALNGLLVPVICCPTLDVSSANLLMPGGECDSVAAHLLTADS
jgi:hypothetical protein